MSLAGWRDAGWLGEHKPSRDETRALLDVIDRDLRDSAVAAISPDTQLGLAYNAALQAATIALAASGYRASRERKHYITIQSLTHTIGTDPVASESWMPFGRNATSETTNAPVRHRSQKRPSCETLHAFSATTFVGGSSTTIPSCSEVVPVHSGNTGNALSTRRRNDLR